MNTEAIYKHKKPFPLECGQKLNDLQITYHTFGSLNAKKDNVFGFAML